MTTATLPASIDRTGATDVTVPLNAWLKSLPNGTTAQLPAGAVLRVEGGAQIIDKDGFGLTTPAVDPAQLISRTAVSGSNRCVLTIIGGKVDVTNVVARGGSLVAGHAETAYLGIYEGMHNIAAYGVDRLNLVCVGSFDSRADLLYMGRRKIGAAKLGRAAYKWCSNVNVVDGSYLRGGRQAFTVSAGTNIDLSPKEVGLVPRHIVDIEPNLAAYNGAAGVIFHDSKVRAARLGLMALSGCGPVDDITLQSLACETSLDVWAQEGAKSPAGGPRRSGFTMVGCTSAAVSGNSLGGTSRFDKWDGITIGFNRQPMGVGRNMHLAVVTANCTDVNVAWNDLPNAAGDVKVVNSL